MKDKKGFVFLETIVILMVVTLSLTLLYASYSLVSRKTKEKEVYDKASDKYLLYSISNLGTTNKYNYTNILVKNGSKIISITPDNCYLTGPNNLDNIFSSKVESGGTIHHCTNIFNELNVVHLYLIGNVYAALHDENATKILDNGTIEYMKTIERCHDSNVFTGTVNENGNTVSKTVVLDDNNDIQCNDPIRYMIGVFYRNQKYYFASIEI